MSAEDRKARNKLAVRPLSQECLEVRKATRTAAQALAKQCARPGIDAALEYCTPWRKVLRTAESWLVEKMPVWITRVVRADEFILRIGYGSRKRFYRYWRVG
jgi:hypothetical protein